MSEEEKHPYEKFLEGGEQYAKHLDRGEHSEADEVLAKRNEELKKARVLEIDQELEQLDSDFGNASQSNNKAELERLRLKSRQLLLERAQLTGEKKDRNQRSWNLD